MNLNKLLACMIILHASTSAAREGSSASGASASGLDGETDARKAYEKGQNHYELGEYSAAVTLFRRAYELSSAPGLLFNIAQAYRLSGDCAKALDEYRHFVRLDPQSSRRDDADAYIAQLGAECGPKRPAPVAPQPAAPPIADVRAPNPRSPPYAPSSVPPPKMAISTKIGWTLLGTGLALGLGAGSLYLWNDGRYATWTKEDRALAMPPPTDGTQRTAWLERQNANDNLLSSIHGVDRASAILAGTSAACVVAATAIALVKRERPPEVAVGSQGMQLSWRFGP
jgi:tetratricopeptide (TPR) repeat protein